MEVGTGGERGTEAKHESSGYREVDRRGTSWRKAQLRGIGRYRYNEEEKSKLLHGGEVNAKGTVCGRSFQASRLQIKTRSNGVGQISRTDDDEDNLS